MTALLQVQGLGKTFGGLRALSGVSFDVRPGEILGVMGANGAGKTTLFGLIAGHVRPTTGDILFEGRSLVGLRPDLICRRGLCRTFQIVRPFAGLSVQENVEVAARFGAAAARGAALQERAQDALAAVGLADRAADPAGALTLSGQKRLEVARALATGAKCVMLDEVMAGLTPVEGAEMMEVVARLNVDRGLTILIIEHVMRALMRLSHRILVLHHGEPIALGGPAEVAADPRVQQAYLGA